MQTPEDLNDLERRLADWQPSAAGLDPDAVLFAAGRASARPGAGRFVWPTVSAGLAVLAVALGIGLRSERAERIALAQLLQPRQPPVAVVASVPSPPPEPLPRDSYFVLGRLLERDIVAGLAPVADPVPPGPPPPSVPILSVGQRTFWPDS